MDVPAQLHPHTTKDIKKLAINTLKRPEQDWEVLPYHEEGKEKESCDNTRIKTTKANKQQFGTKEKLSIPKGKLEGVLDDHILNMKMEIKLGQLIKIFPQLQKILTRFFLKMQKEHVSDVCIVGTHHTNDFDEAMPVVQVSIGNCEIMDVLLDGGSRINIIFEHRKLGLKKP
jgi:hypothetical protein